MEVLIVDDYPSYSHILEHVLRHALAKNPDDGSLKFSHAPTIAEAHRFTSENHSFDLIVIDLSLPDGNGVEIVRKVKTLNPDTPVAVLSVSGDLSEALAAGADEAMSKLSAVSNIVDRFKHLAGAPDNHSLQDV